MKITNRGVISGFVALSIYATAFSVPLYAQQATPSPRPGSVAALDGKETKEVKKVAKPYVIIDKKVI